MKMTVFRIGRKQRRALAQSNPARTKRPINSCKSSQHLSDRHRKREEQNSFDIERQERANQSSIATRAVRVRIFVKCVHAHRGGTLG